MAKTKHMHQRMNQRGINQVMLEATRMFGIPDGDKIILDRKAIDRALTELRKLQNSMQKMRERGGLVLVEVEGQEITTYGLEGHRRH